jgi:hypothetical protein
VVVMSVSLLVFVALVEDI